MFWRLLKQVLKIIVVEISFKNGDQLKIKLLWMNHTVFDRTIDIIKGA